VKKVVCGSTNLSWRGGCPLDGQADAEMFGLDSSSSSKPAYAG